MGPQNEDAQHISRSLDVSHTEAAHQSMRFVHCDGQTDVNQYTPLLQSRGIIMYRKARKHYMMKQPKDDFGLQYLDHCLCQRVQL